MFKNRFIRFLGYALLLMLVGAKLHEGISTGCFHVSRVGVIDCLETSPFGYYFTFAFLVVVSLALSLLGLCELLGGEQAATETATSSSTEESLDDGDARRSRPVGDEFTGAE